MPLENPAHILRHRYFIIDAPAVFSSAAALPLSFSEEESPMQRQAKERGDASSSSSRLLLLSSLLPQR